MTDEILKRDQNRVTVLAGVTDDANQYTTMLRVDPVTKRLLISATGAGTGTVSEMQDSDTNGVAITWTDPTTEPSATVVLGDITPSSVNISGLTASQIVATDGSKNIQTLTTATYPSLTELSYVKGITSAIQTQLNTKQATIAFGTGVQTALGVNVGSAGAVILFNGDAGTPSALVGTNISGTASSLTAGAVTGFTPASGSLTLSGDDALTLTTSAATNITLPTTGTLATLAGTETFTNKRITKRVVTTASDTTAVIDSDSYDEYYLTAMAGATEISVTGTPTTGQTIFIGLKDDGTGRALTWTGITALGVTLPTTTVANKQHIIGIKYISSAWWAIAVGVQA
jgi:hypothetical protein